MGVLKSKMKNHSGAVWLQGKGVPDCNKESPRHRVNLGRREREFSSEMKNHCATVRTQEGERKFSSEIKNHGATVRTQ